MTAPKTLFEMAGVSQPPATWSNGVLLLIDHQLEYDVGGGLELPDIAYAKAELVRLLSAARAHQTPVVHVAHHGKLGGALFDPTGPKAAFMQEAVPQDGEAVVIKPLPNSFAKTELQTVLEKTGRKNLIVAGFMTHMCVSSTTRSAQDHGYLVTLVANACATRDLADTCGHAVPADVVHQVVLAELADRFAVIVKSADQIGA